LREEIMFARQYGPWALIAGGSEGVGASFARKLAGEGLNLVLVARKPGPLTALADELRTTRGVAVRELAQDLTAPDALDDIRAITDDIDIGLLIYNAGSVSGFAEFLDAPLEDALRMARLGVVAPTLLTHHFAGRMRPRGRGGIILIGSMASYAGAPDEIVYSAGNAYSQHAGRGVVVRT
jgi:short-subunit dehydrogenase